MKYRFEFRYKTLPKLRLQLPLTFRRHFFKIKNVDQLTNQLKVLAKIAIVNRRQIDLTLDFAFSPMGISRSDPESPVR